MEDIIRILTHDNDKFKDQWDEIENRLTQDCDSNNIISILDALVEYVLQEPETQCPCKQKFDFLTVVFNALNYEDSVLEQVFQIFFRVFNQSCINLWYLTFLKALYRHFQLNKYLPQRPPLVEQLFNSLQNQTGLLSCTKKSILESWERFFCNDIFDNYLLNEQILEISRDKFQQLYRFGIRKSSSSSFWSTIAAHLIRNISGLFDSYVKLTDAQYDLELYCITETSNYKKLILKSFSNHVNIFAANYNQILLTTECLLTKNTNRDGEFLLNDVILKHSSAIPDLEPLVQLLIRISRQIPSEKKEEFTTRILDNFTFKLETMKISKKLWPLLFDLAVIILELHTFRAPSSAEQLLNRENFYPWQELGERLSGIVHLCGSYDDYILDDKSFFTKLDSLEDILEIIYTRAKVYNNLFRNTHSEALIYTLRWASSLQQYPIHVYKMGKYMIDLIDRKQVTSDIVFQLLEKLQNRILIEEEFDESRDTEPGFFVHLATRVGIYIEILKTLPISIHRLLNSIFLAILNQPLQDEKGSATIRQKIFHYLWTNFLSTLITEEETQCYEESIGRLYMVARNEMQNDENIFRYWSSFWDKIGICLPQIAVNQIATILSEFLDREEMNFVHLLQNLYPQRPEPFHARLNDIIQHCFQNKNKNNQYRGFYIILLQAISRHHPEIFSSTHIELIFSSFSTTASNLTDTEVHGIFRFLAPIASVQPHLYDKNQNDLIRMATETQNNSVIYCLQQYFISSTIVNGETVASDYLTKLIDLLQRKEGCTVDNRTLLIHACKLIGIHHRQVLEARKADFVKLNCSELVQLIDNNKMTEENRQVLEQSRQEIEAIETKVQKTTNDIQQINSKVKHQELHITNMQVHVNNIDKNLQNLTECVDIHQKEIERIDGKTLSYVPAWASEICKLLNRRTPNDWRLLGQRFGYSASELKHWATQFDPCMALLNEWYMTHKSDEATFGLLKILKEIGRQDAEVIVQNALRDAGETIPDNILDFDIQRLPPVFISYQWNSQPMVIKLKEHLEEAGYSCWMDVGQMSGGQELQRRIDKGIRGAKVILCCINRDYATSDACIREVNLAISTGKPLIPLQMEKQIWPPEGALGPLMSDYLFIRFFDRKATNDPNFWPDERFTELLGQIRYYAAPNPDMIREPYTNWFVPRAENLIFLKDSDVNDKKMTKFEDSTKPSLINTPLVVSHPQIMISYQWDRQTDIIDLYKRLTELGYRVWLDIFQMGGGDSLFAKIDHGIRNAQCVLACITPKYTMSINCRREMSLADAIGKPIVPLFMEQLPDSWPPTGPMSLVFADRHYIDFRSHQRNDMWSGKEYAQVLLKLKELVPEIQIENPQRHLIEMERPTSAVHLDKLVRVYPTRTRKRRGSAPVIPQSQACSLM